MCGKLVEWISVVSESLSLKCFLSSEPLRSSKHVGGLTSFNEVRM